MDDTTLYLDHAATTPLRPEALDAMRRVLVSGFGNASSVHGAGRAGRAVLEEARATVARLLGATPAEIVFTSGGTEANNLAILGRWRAAGLGVVVSAIEHSAVREPAAEAARQGAAHTTVAVDEEGRVDLDGLGEALEARPGVVSVMWANNETGVLQPVEEVAALCSDRGVTFHTDAVQAVGHAPVRMDEVRCDLLSLSAHKFGGPTGVGALFVRRGTELAPMIRGGGQERGVRAGTSNIAGAAGLAAALEVACKDREAEDRRLAPLRDRLQARLRERVPALHVNSGGARRLPHVLSIGLDGIPADLLVASLDMAGLAVSSGSACRSGAGERSHVMVAMGRSADAVVRFSLGWSTRADEIDRCADLFLDVLDRARVAA